jgi:hypothetical protein
VTLDSGTLKLGSAGAAGSGAIIFSGTVDHTVEFAKAAAPTTVFLDFASDDHINVTDLTFDGATEAQSVVRQSLATDTYVATFQEGASSIQLNFDSPTTLTTASFVLSQNGAGTEIAACYVKGARILTQRGEVAVEHLSLGDIVTTAFGGSRPIIWLGHRRVDISRHPDPATVRPVRVCADAFGKGLPRRDLWLSPGHNVASEGALIPISCLINGRSVAQIEQVTVEYWHVELDAHDVILAEGLPAESYLDCGNRTAFANGGAFVEAHPDFRPRDWAETCLPLMTKGPAVTATKARLLARLAEIGHLIDREADAHILVDGCRVEPTHQSEWRLHFKLPEGGREIALRSKVFVPTHTIAESADARALGLCVGRLQIDGSTVTLADDEACVSGWHQVESADRCFSHRWTNGATPLPSGVRFVIVDLAGIGHYWREPEDRAAALSG